MRKGIGFALAGFVAVSVLVLPAYAFKAGKTEVKKSAEEEKLTKAPKFPKGQWLNSQPLTQKNFKDKVTLVYFWDYASINCIREMETIKSWASIYANHNFQVILVHSPEFKFPNQKEVVERAADRFGITLPIFMDDDFKLWDSYDVRSWPTKVIINGEGKIAATFIGEENLHKTEAKIRRLAKDLAPGVKLPGWLVRKENHRYTEFCGVMSGETYVGYKRADWWGATVANQKWVPKDKPFMYKDRGERVERGFFINGLWESKEDDFKHARATEELTDYLGMIYMGHEVYSMVNSNDKNAGARIYVTRDEDPVPAEMRGKDLKEDEEGKTYFQLDGPRLYYLIANEDQDPHELRLWIAAPDISVHSFAFSNRCLSEFEHR